jgi:nucleotide-binding universal stress UspA family protein
MTWRPVVVGVDPSPEGVQAAAAGLAVAQATSAPCHLVHVAKEPTAPHLPTRDRERLAEGWTAAARGAVEEYLRNRVQPEALERLEVRVGNPTWMLAQAVTQHRAELLVLGGKHHAAPVRWFGGSTVHNAVRTIDVPLLVVTAPMTTFHRVLVAVDQSDAAALALHAAQRFSNAFAATLRVLHVVEPLPSVPDVGVQLNEEEHIRLAEASTNELLDAAAPGRQLDRVVRVGAPARSIADEAAEWKADLVIVGSHGKGWVDRVLLGSTTERLLNRLPTSVLVVPVRGAGQNR